MPSLVGVRLLRHPDFRRLMVAVLANSVGMLGEQVVLGWLTLELTDSPLMVGVALGLRMLPLLLTGIPAGVLADRADRVRLLQSSSAGVATASVILAALILLGVVAVWHVLLLTFAAGCVRALHQTARQSYVHDLVGAAGLVEGLAVIGLAMRLGGLAGSLLVGWLIARLGPGAAYLAVAGGYLASLAALLRTRGRPLDGAPTRDTVREGVAGLVEAVRRERMLAALIGLTAASEVLGFSHQALLPSLARDVFRVGPEGLGVLTAARSVGGLVGNISVTRLGTVRGNGPLFFLVLFLFGASLVGLGVAPGFGSVVAILLVVNAMGAMSDILSQSLIQLSVPSELRGRAGGAWLMAVGLGPFGQLEIGALASFFGVSVALGLNGLALVVVGVGGALLLPRIRHL